MKILELEDASNPFSSAILKLSFHSFLKRVPSNVFPHDFQSWLEWAEFPPLKNCSPGWSLVEALCPGSKESREVGVLLTRSRVCSLVKEPHQAAPVGCGQAQLRLKDALITISQYKKDPFDSAQGSRGKSRSPRQNLHSPIIGDPFSSAALTKGWMQHAVLQAAPCSSMWKWLTAVMNIKPPLMCSQTGEAAVGEEGELWTLALWSSAERDWTHLAPSQSFRRNPGWVITPRTP